MEILKNVWPFIVLQVVLALWAIIDMVRQKKTRNLSIGFWIMIVLFLNLIGPLLYFTVGRNDE